MLKQAIGTFKIYPCSDLSLLNKIDGKAFYGEPYASGGIGNKYLCTESHSGAQAARNKNFKHFKNDHDICEFLISSDVAARGIHIDVEPLAFVMNVTMI